MPESSIMAGRLGRDGPRLRVVHFFAWMLGCGLAILGYQQITWSNLRPEVRSFEVVYNVTMSMAFGWALGVVAVLACGWVQGDRRFPSLPGHWLLVFAGVAGLLNATVTAIFEILAVADPDRWLWTYCVQFTMHDSATRTGLYHQFIGWGAGAVAGMFFLWRLRGRLAWPWFLVFVLGFLLSAILSAWYGLVWLGAHSQFGIGWGVHLYAAFIFAAVLAIMAAVLSDARSRKRRDWLHWTGVAVWLALAAVQMTAYILIVRVWL